jgi:imidazoleglycerol-phosphate dehydratase
VSRVAERRRATKETSVEIRLDLDGSGAAEVATGLPFFDHMLSQLARHGALDLAVHAVGDLDVDAHHTVEDTGIVLGETIAEALGDKRGIRRFASCAIPLDESLVDVALDCAGRAFLHYDVALPADAAPLGQPGFHPQLAEEFWRSVVSSAGLTLHIGLRYGRNQHHVLEASFKGVARALREAVRIEGGGEIPSTKGVL